MEPLKPSDKKKILELSPAAAPAEVDEYERLLSARFTVDPDTAAAPQGKLEAALSSIEGRLKALHEKLFLSKKGS